VAVEMAAGLGPHSERAGETWFRDTHRGMLRIGGLIRGPMFGDRVAAIARFEYSVRGPGDQLDDCPIAPNETCKEYFPNTSGPSIGLGALASATSHVLIGVDAGLVRSFANRYVAVNASYAISSHVAVLVDWRYLKLEYTSWPFPLAADSFRPAPVATRVSFRPVQLGMRVF